MHSAVSWPNFEKVIGWKSTAMAPPRSGNPPTGRLMKGTSCLQKSIQGFSTVSPFRMDDPRITSPFQGFSQGWMALPWAMRHLIGLPTDALEPALPRQANLARRIAGTGGWHWFPLALKALRDISIEATTPFWVVFSGTERVARSVSAWADSQDIRPLQVTCPFHLFHRPSQRRLGFPERTSN